MTGPMLPIDESAETEDDPAGTSPVASVQDHGIPTDLAYPILMVVGVVLGFSRGVNFGPAMTFLSLLIGGACGFVGAWITIRCVMGLIWLLGRMGTAKASHSTACGFLTLLVALGIPIVVFVATLMLVEEIARRLK